MIAPMTTPILTKLTPNLIVSSIEACLPFWIGRLGFEKVVEVPHEKTIGFVSLRHGGVELMLQSRASVASDVAPIAHDSYRSVLYVAVPSLDPLRTIFAAAELVVPERKTFYGATELIVRDPEGNVVFFAAR